MRTIDFTWFLTGNVPSLKNGKRISRVNNTTIVRKSCSVDKYLNAAGIKKYSSSNKTVSCYTSCDRLNNIAFALQDCSYEIDLASTDGEDTINITSTFEKLVKIATKNYNTPLVLGFHQVRDSHRKFDFGNSVELLTDLLTAHDIIPDDSMTHLIPVPVQMNNSWYTVNKKEAGVYLSILNHFEYE